MQKILILGNGGSGKSTLARKMSEILNIPVIHLDVYYWNPGWVATPDEEWITKVEELLSGDSWIIDGNYTSTMRKRVGAADTVIFLDMPLMLSLCRVVKRRIMYHGRSRPDMCEGCNEKLDLDFIRWILRFNKRKPQVRKELESLRGIKNIIILRGVKQVREFLDGLGQRS
mgnify:CR=1 FL=1